MEAEQKNILENQKAERIFNFPKAWIWPFLLVVFGLIIYSKGLWNEEVFYPDADRIAMDGAYFHDVLKDLPVTHLYDYTIRYYAQYPALSVGYREPLFPLIEGIFYHLWGINMSTAKLAIIAFALWGILLFYKLAFRIYGNKTAIFSTLLFITTPFVFIWTRVPMLEIPALAMTLGTVYYFYKYAESEEKKALWIFFLMFALTLWTKKMTAFLFLFFLAYLLVKRKWKVIFRKEVWMGCLFLVLALTPLVLITIWLGDTNLEQSIGNIQQSRNLSAGSKFPGQGLLFYLKAIYKVILPLPVLLLSALGALFAVLKKDKRAFFSLLWIASVFIFAASLKAKEPRYAVYFIPAFCMLAASLAETAAFHKKSLTRLASFLLAGIIIFQSHAVWHERSLKTVGFKEAAQYVTDHPKGYTVFYDGYGNGLFIFWVRKYDENKKFIVLRGDKLLTSSSISFKNKLKVYVKSADEINELFRKYGTSHIVVEEKDSSGILIHSTLRGLLKSEKFKLVKRIPIESGDKFLKGNHILIYERLEPPSLPAGELVLPLPVVGKTIRFPVEELTPRFNAK